MCSPLFEYTRQTTSAWSLFSCLPTLMFSCVPSYCRANLPRGEPFGKAKPPSLQSSHSWLATCLPACLHAYVLPPPLASCCSYPGSTFSVPVYIHVTRGFRPQAKTGQDDKSYIQRSAVMLVAGQRCRECTVFSG